MAHMPSPGKRSLNAIPQRDCTLSLPCRRFPLPFRPLTSTTHPPHPLFLVLRRSCSSSWRQSLSRVQAWICSVLSYFSCLFLSLLGIAIDFFPVCPVFYCPFPFPQLSTLSPLSILGLQCGDPPPPAPTPPHPLSLDLRRRGVTGGFDNEERLLLVSVQAWVSVFVFMCICVCVCRCFLVALVLPLHSFPCALFL
jgi:hypothetical protein